MAYEQRDNSGSAFPNDKKKSERHPDFKGKAMIGGVMYFFDLWKKPGRGGATFVSASFKKMDKQPGGQINDDDIPM